MEAYKSGKSTAAELYQALILNQLNEAMKHAMANGDYAGVEFFVKKGASFDMERCLFVQDKAQSAGMVNFILSAYLPRVITSAIIKYVLAEDFTAADALIGNRYRLVDIQKIIGKLRRLPECAANDRIAQYVSILSDRYGG